MIQGFELLKQLYKIHSPSGSEKKMRKFLREQCKLRGAIVEQDTIGNLYITKGIAESYPCICAHMDQVQQQHSKDFTVIECGDVLFAYSPKSGCQQGLGADDKNGLWIALELLSELDSLKCAFFVSEEVGCIGSSHANMDFFENVRYIIEPDRRGSSDLITEISQPICSQDFINAIDYELFGYEPTQGMLTDVDILCRQGVGISCINISCGYHKPHTDQEYTVRSELYNALDFARHICKLEESFPLDYNTLSWNSYDYDYDYYTMELILHEEIYLTFEEVLQKYGSQFIIQDADILRPIYDDVLYELKNTLTNL